MEVSEGSESSERGAVLEVKSETLGEDGEQTDGDALDDEPEGEELKLEDSADIVSRVDEPRKVVEPWGTYVAFRVRTRTARWDPSGREREYSVRRRYNDFRALRERLDSASFQVVPPLPARHTLLAQLDRYEREFVLQRTALLDVFIRRLVSHSILAHNDDLKAFLTATPAELRRSFKARRPSRPSTSLYASTVSAVADSLYGLTSPNGNPRDPEFAAIDSYTVALREKLERFDAIATRVATDRSDASEEAKALPPALRLWSQTERFNRDTLGRTPESELDSERLADALVRAADPFEAISAELRTLADESPYSLVNPLREYALYADAVREKIAKRDGMQANLEAARDRLTRKRADGSTDPRLAEEVDECHDRLQCASEALRSDLCGWQRQKRTDLKVLLLGMAERHVRLYERSLSSWETARGRPSDDR